MHKLGIKIHLHCFEYGRGQQPELQQYCEEVIYYHRESLAGIIAGRSIGKNQQIARLGNIDENGHWPPHLHFQLMFNMEGRAGDYPGVVRFSEKQKYLPNIPDPNLILKFNTTP